ncbi:MAG: hypothetical protein EOP56_04770 [Sphingobacteriales bacterium]|nr:MAG: hypothetical protein EOP56_04770 [Sphingobacteriales bacterium]
MGQNQNPNQNQKGSDRERQDNKKGEQQKTGGSHEQGNRQGVGTGQKDLQNDDPSKKRQDHQRNKGNENKETGKKS